MSFHNWLSRAPTQSPVPLSEANRLIPGFLANRLLQKQDSWSP